jgi:ribonuclease R
MTAERDTTDRYLAAFLADRVGSDFSGRISGVQGFGLFVKLDDTGADGLVPIRAIGHEFFHYDRDSQTLTGADTGIRLGIGQRVTVRLAEATPVTGGLMLELLTLDGAEIPAGRSGPRRGGYTPRAPGRAKAYDDKVKRKIVRKRR